MKYLIVILVVLAVVWFVRAGRRREETPSRPTAAPGTRKEIGKPQEMVDCAHCGLHLPAVEAERGEDGRHYCSRAHRLAGPR